MLAQAPLFKMLLLLPAFQMMLMMVTHATDVITVYGHVLADWQPDVDNYHILLTFVKIFVIYTAPLHVAAYDTRDVHATQY